MNTLSDVLSPSQAVSVEWRPGPCSPGVPALATPIDLDPLSSGDIVTIVSVIVAAIGVGFAAAYAKRQIRVAQGQLQAAREQLEQQSRQLEQQSKQLKQQSQTTRGQFLLALHERFREHESIHLRLRNAESDYKWWRGPEPSGDEWAEVEAYMGLFERVWMLVKGKSIDINVIERLYGYRVVNIVINDKIREEKLDDQATAKYHTPPHVTGERPKRKPERFRPCAVPRSKAMATTSALAIVSRVRGPNGAEHREARVVSHARRCYEHGASWPGILAPRGASPQGVGRPPPLRSRRPRWSFVTERKGQAAPLRRPTPVTSARCRAERRPEQFRASARPVREALPHRESCASHFHGRAPRYHVRLG